MRGVEALDLEGGPGGLDRGARRHQPHELGPRDLDPVRLGLGDDAVNDLVQGGRLPFATDPVVGYERYTQDRQLLSATGTMGALSGGTVKVEVWNAIGNQPTTLGVGSLSRLDLPLR